jgi:glycosyltransferase involved in cell wall biosynthesis
MVPCIESLLVSDLSNYDFELYYIDNNSTDGTYEYMQTLNCKKWVKQNKINEGITLPRIEIMNKILEDDKNTYTLEIHADMLFPAKWISYLLSEFDDKTAIVMPFILNNPHIRINIEELERLVKIHSSDEIFNCVRQVHPWVLNNQIIKHIGYYDVIFAPQECEDDDLMFRIMKNNYLTKAVKNSIVCHYGGATRRLSYDNLTNKLHLFKHKNGVSVDDMVTMFTLHPIINRF